MAKPYNGINVKKEETIIDIIVELVYMNLQCYLDNSLLIVPTRKIMSIRLFDLPYI